jgi:hypothetical protein
MKTRRGGNIFAVQKDGMALQHIPKTYENVLAAVKQNGLALQFAGDFQDNERITHAAVKQNVAAFEFVSPRFKDNKTFVSNILAHDGDMLEFTSARLKDDDNMVRIATRRFGYPLQYASDRLRSNKEFVAQCGLEYASDIVKEDKDFLLQHPSMLEFASERLKDDKDVVMAAVSISGKLVYFASERLKSDPDVTDAAIAQDPTSLHFIRPLPFKKKLTRRYSRGYTNQGQSLVCGYHAFSKVILKNVFEMLHPLRETSVYVEQQCNRYLDTSRHDLSDLTPEKCSSDGYLKILLFLHLFHLYLSVQDRTDGMVCGTESSIFHQLYDTIQIPSLSYRHYLALRSKLDSMKSICQSLSIRLVHFQFEPHFETIQRLTDAGLYLMLFIHPIHKKSGHFVVIVGTNGNEIVFKDSYGVEEVYRFVFGRRFLFSTHYYQATKCSVVIPINVKPGTPITFEVAFANYLYLKTNPLLLHEGFV